MMLEMEKQTLPQEGSHAGSALAPLASSLNRRNFLFTAGLTAGAASLVGLTSGCGGLIGVDPSSGPAPSAVDILQFALNLEYLEANFYLYITTGSGLPPQYQGTNPGKVTGGAPVIFSDPEVTAFAQELAADELAHVRLLRAGLTAAGVTPVDMPALNLAALGKVTNDATFLATARALETVGTSAYEGGIASLTTSVEAVNYAARIHDTEGQHEGVLRQFCIAKGISSPKVDTYDRPPVLSSTGIFNTSDITGLNTARNASEVLQIVYGAPGQTGVSAGGFFPNGLNGAVKTT